MDTKYFFGLLDVPSCTATEVQRAVGSQGHALPLVVLVLVVNPASAGLSGVSDCMAGRPSKGALTRRANSRAKITRACDCLFHAAITDLRSRDGNYHGHFPLHASLHVM